MALNRFETRRFIYVQYKRDTVEDVRRFRSELGHIKKKSDSCSKRIVLDFTGCGPFAAPEICAVAELLRSLRGKQKRLTMIVDRERIELTSAIGANDIDFYDSWKVFVDQCTDVRKGSAE